MEYRSKFCDAAHEDVLVAAISSQVPRALAPEEFLIPAGELAACGLPKQSIVRIAKIIALHRGLIIRRLGAMPPATLADVLARIRQLF